MCWIDLKVELEGRMKIEDYFVIHCSSLIHALYLFILRDFIYVQVQTQSVTACRTTEMWAPYEI